MALEIFFNPAILIVWILSILVFYAFISEEKPTRVKTLLLGTLQFIVIVITSFLMRIAFDCINIINFNIFGIVYILCWMLVSFFGAVLGSLILGWFLRNYCVEFPNGSFSAFKYSGYKNFIRMHLNTDTLTIYSIGLKDIPNRGDWEINTKYKINNQNEPAFVLMSNSHLKPRLIEKITIHWKDIN